MTQVKTGHESYDRDKDELNILAVIFLLVIIIWPFSLWEWLFGSKKYGPENTKSEPEKRE